MGALARGLVAGAAGTAALNVVTYLDMAARGRSASSMPAEAAGKLAHVAGVGLGEGDTERNRTEGLGALLGYATGLGVGASYGLVRARVHLPTPVGALLLGAAAMAGSDVPLTALGLTDPRSWPLSSWAMDVVPHLAYGVVTAWAFDLLSD